MTEQLTPEESVIIVKKLLSMEKNIAILRSQNQLLVNAIAVAGYEIHLDKGSNKLFLKALPLDEPKKKPPATSGTALAKKGKKDKKDPPVP